MTVEEKGQALIERLQALSSDRGSMANLRRAINPSQESGCWPLLGSVVVLNNDREYEIAKCVASSYALHPKIGEHSFAHALRVLSKFGEDKGIDARFKKLLSERGQITGVTEKVLQLVKRIKREGISIDYLRLYKDLTYWGDKVRRRWASEYWAYKEKEEK